MPSNNLANEPKDLELKGMPRYIGQRHGTAVVVLTWLCVRGCTTVPCKYMQRYRHVWDDHDVQVSSQKGSARHMHRDNVGKTSSIGNA